MTGRPSSPSGDHAGTPVVLGVLGGTADPWDGLHTSLTEREATYAVDAFIRMGWSPDQCNDLYRFFARRDVRGAGGLTLASWLRHPPGEFVIPITAVMVQEVFARRGKQTVPVLTALAAGGSERFAVAFQEHHRDNSVSWSVYDGWQYAGQIGLAEAQATGWAMTGYLGRRRDKPSTGHASTTLPGPDLAVLISRWVDVFGPDAWLHVLAGFTLDEATAMRDAGQCPSEEQLRVMVALAGHTLPAGV